MKTERAQAWLRSTLAALVGALACVLLRFALEPLLGDEFGFMFFLPAIGFVVWREGRRAGALLTVLSVIAVWYFWLPPYRSFAPPDGTAMLHVVAFIAIGALTVLLIGRGRDAVRGLDVAHQREREARIELEVTLRSMGDAMIATDSGGCVTFMNPAAEQLTGWPFASARGGPIETVFATLHGESRAIRQSPVRKVLATGERASPEPDTVLLRRDGKTLPVAPVAAPVVADDGALRGAVLLFRDTTEEVRVRRALAEANAALSKQVEDFRVLANRFSLAAQTETLTLFEQDRDLRYRWLYPLHHEHASALGFTDEELLPPAEAAPLIAVKRSVLCTGLAQWIEVRTTLATGLRYYDITVSPRHNALGEVDGVCGVALDITDRKLAELAAARARDELRRTNAELEERVRARTSSITELLNQMEGFCDSVSHDLRGPLRTVAAFAEALKVDHSPGLDAEGRVLVDRILRSSRRMNRLVGDVLAYSRAQRNELVLGPVSLASCIADVVQSTPELQPPAALVRWPETLPAVMANEAAVTQVFANLLANAVKFVHPDRAPEVTVSADCCGDRVRVWVADNGIGIKPEDRSRLFQMFERLDSGRRFEGTGIGLALVRRAVERMGGNVGVESDGVSGSRFWFELPGATTDVYNPDGPSIVALAGSAMAS